MSLKYLIKKTDDVLDYDVDYKRWLADNDRIIEASAIVNSDDIKINSVEWSTDIVKIWIAGGAPNRTATVSVTIKTLFNRTKKECFKLRIKECSL